MECSQLLLLSLSVTQGANRLFPLVAVEFSCILLKVSDQLYNWVLQERIVLLCDWSKSRFEVSELSHVEFCS